MTKTVFWVFLLSTFVFLGCVGTSDKPTVERIKKVTDINTTKASLKVKVEEIGLLPVSKTMDEAQELEVQEVPEAPISEENSVQIIESVER